LSIRSFTLGYDLFHPHQTIVWHEYRREGRVKHWMDHSIENKPLVGLTWYERDDISRRRMRKLLQEENNDEDISGYGLGTVRTHRDYELYAGIDFAGRRLHKETVRGCEPPCSYVTGKQWEASLTKKLEIAAKKGRATKQTT
jgi:Glycosyltransferase (GlcNAc)